MIAHWIKSFTLWEFVKAHWLTLKYFFKPKATISHSTLCTGLRANTTASAGAMVSVANK